MQYGELLQAFLFYVYELDLPGLDHAEHLLEVPKARKHFMDLFS
jgi:hypothetical protein